MNLFDKLTDKARKHPQRIVLPEGLEPRTLTAADRIIADGLAQIILIGDKTEIRAMARELKLENISKATIVDPTDEAVVERYAPLFYELRKSKGISMEEARLTTANPLYLGCLMVKAGDADGQEHHRQRAPRRLPGNQDRSRHQRGVRRVRDAAA